MADEEGAWPQAQGEEGRGEEEAVVGDTVASTCSRMAGATSVFTFIKSAKSTESEIEERSGTVSGSCAWIFGEEGVSCEVAGTARAESQGEREGQGR